MRSSDSSRVEVFQYRTNGSSPPPLWEVLTEIGAAASCTTADGEEKSDTEDREPPGAIGAEETERVFEAGRQQGMQEERAAAAENQRILSQEAEKKRADQAVNLAVQYAREHESLLASTEREVVKLALAIAARILRRESQTDPLFLLGAVRVALGQLAGTVQIKLRIPASEAELWTETLAHLPNLKRIPMVIADTHMQLGDCLVETEMGSVNLGLTAQLQETERILFHGPSADSFERRAAQGIYGKEERV